jgi:hypothetical protein
MKNFEIEIKDQEIRVFWKLKIRKSKGFWRASLVGLPIASMSEERAQVLYDIKQKLSAFLSKLIEDELEKLGFEG